MGKWDAEYVASPTGWVAEQVETYEASGGTEANTLRETGIPIIVMWTIGASSGLLRKVPLMRVEADGEYAIIASKGGAPDHPAWYHNLVADPEVRIQDGPAPLDYRVDLADGDERQRWWDLGVSVFPNYAKYEITATEAGRVIPVFIARPQ